MAGDDLSVTIDQFFQLIDRVSVVEDRIKAIQAAPTDTPANRTISTHVTPYIVQHYHFQDRNRVSQELSPASPPGPGSLDRPQRTNRPGPPSTTIKNGKLQKAVPTSEPDPANAVEQRRTAGPRLLGPLDGELQPVLVPGPLTDLNTGWPMFMVPRGLSGQFKGRFNLGYQGPANGVPGYWEYFSEGPSGDSEAGSAELEAHTNLGGQGHWTPDIARPSADQVHELRDRLRASKKEDVTRNIDLTWVPDQNLPKEDRDKLLKSLSSDRENDEHENVRTNTNSNIQSELKNAAGTLLKPVEVSKTSNDAANDKTGKRKPSHFTEIATAANEHHMGRLDRDPVGNKGAILKQSLRSGGTRSGSVPQVPASQTSRRTTCQTGVPIIPSHPSRASKQGQKTSSRKWPARKSRLVLTSKNDENATIERTSATTDSQRGRSAEQSQFTALPPAEEGTDSDLTDVDEDLLKSVDQRSGTVQRSSHEKRRASEADPDVDTERRRPQKRLRSIPTLAAGERRQPFVPMTQEQARADFRARFSRTTDRGGDHDTVDDLDEEEEDEGIEDGGAQVKENSEQDKEGSKKKGKRKGKKKAKE